MTVREQERLIAAHRRATKESFEDIVRFLDETLGRVLTAYIADVDPKTIVRWTGGGKPSHSTDAEARLRLAYNIFVLLQEQDGQHIVRAWFIGLNPQLGDLSPAEALRAGKLRQTLTAAKSFALGG